MPKLNDLQAQMAAIQAKLDLVRAQTGNLPARPLPDRRPDLIFPETDQQVQKLLAEEVKRNTKRGNVEQTLQEVGNVAANALSLAPLSLAGPLAIAANTGIALGNLANVGMRAYEREQERRLGSPKERAEKAYGKGIEARIQRNSSKERKFR